MPRTHVHLVSALIAILALTAPTAAVGGHEGRDPKLSGPAKVTPREPVTFRAKGFVDVPFRRVGVAFEPKRHRQCEYQLCSNIERRKWTKQANKKGRVKLSFRFPTEYTVLDPQTGPKTVRYRDGDRVSVELYAFDKDEHHGAWIDRRKVTVVID